MSKVQFERFEVWVTRSLGSESKMLGSFESFDLAAVAGDAAFDWNNGVTINHIALTDEGRDEHSWVKSHDDGRWIALDLRTASYAH